MTRDLLVRMMIGRDVTASYYATHMADENGPRRASNRGEKVLSVENVTMGSVVKNMSFSVFEGEVVGMPRPLLRQMVAAGYNGRKAGRGWYRYDKAGKRVS